MRSLIRLFVVVVLALIVATANAFAVGYQRIPVKNPRPVKVHSSRVYTPGGWAAVKKPTFVEKIPGAIDNAAMTVKGLLTQFGLPLQHRR
jgi:hypothetical protein